MATNSIMRRIVVKDKRFGRQLLNALENASRVKSKEVHLTKKHREVKGEQIKDLFGK